MSYTSLLAHVCAGHDNGGVCAVSAQLAGLFGARVIGVAGARLTPPFSEVPVADMMQFEQEAAQKSLADLERDFRAAFRGADIPLSWRTVCDHAPVGNFIVQEARAADLILTAPEAGSVLERMDQTHLGPLVLQAGRPVLVVPRQVRELKLHKAAVAWKDTREARRAVADALPLLAKMRSVAVIEVCPPAEVEPAMRRTTDVAQWLNSHGVAAHSMVEAWKGTDLDGLYTALRKEGCDLVVAGAYGHTRLREWVFGGVTMDLLLPGDHCVLLSH